MFEKFLSSNSRDFQQRYLGTFGFFMTADKRRILTKLNHISDDAVLFSDRKGVEYRLNVDAGANVGFEFIPPKSNFYNTPNGVYLVQWQAARQFQRGISPKNVTIHLVNPTGLFTQAQVGFDALDAIYNHPVSAKDVARDRIFSGNPVAVSSQFCFVVGAIYLYDSMIGSYTWGKDQSLVIRLKEPDLWRTEISDTLNGLGINFTIMEKK